MKKIKKNKLSIDNIKKLVAIANSIDFSHPDVSDFIDDFLFENQDQEDLLAALKNEMPEEQALEVLSISKNI